MRYLGDVVESLQKSRIFVLDGGEQILKGRLDDDHSISPSPGATALATLALLALGNGFEKNLQLGIQWLTENRQNQGWSKFPGGEPDPEINHLVQTVLAGSRRGVLARLFLLSQVEELSKMVLTLGERVVHGLEGPKADEIICQRFWMLQSCKNFQIMEDQWSSLLLSWQQKI